MNEQPASNEIVGFGKHEEEIRETLTDIKTNIKDTIGILNDINKNIEEIIDINNPEEFQKRIKNDFCEWQGSYLPPEEQKMFKVKSMIDDVDELITSIQDIEEEFNARRKSRKV